VKELVVRRTALTSPRGPVPVARVVSVMPGCAPWVVNSFESVEKLMGKRSPTKKLAGSPSSARSRMRSAVRTTLSESAKLAAAPGSVARKTVWPPPKAMSGGTSALSEVLPVPSRAEICSVEEPAKAAGVPKSCSMS